MEEKERYEETDIKTMNFINIYDNEKGMLNFLSTKAVCDLLNKQDKENQQLKQQLYDLPKKIIGQIEKCFTEYLPLKDRTGAWFYGKLNEILKKFGGENDKRRF